VFIYEYIKLSGLSLKSKSKKGLWNRFICLCLSSVTSTFDYMEQRCTSKIYSRSKSQ